MRIRSKISILTGGVFLAALLISSLSIWTLNVTARLRDTVDAGNRLIGTALALHGLMKDLMFDLFTPQTYLLLKDLLHTSRVQTTRADFRASLKEFDSSFSAFMQSPGVRGLLRDQELRDTYDTALIMTAKASTRIASFQAAIDTLFAAGMTGDSSLYMQLQTDKGIVVPQFFDEVRETSYYLTYSFESYLTHFIRSLQQESALIQRQVMIVFWSLTAAIGALTFILSLLFAARISNRIRSVEEGVRAVANGDFRARLSIRTTDEFGALADHFNLFMKELKKNVDSVQSLMRDVGESLTRRPSFRRILSLIVEAAVKDSRADGAAVFILDPENGLVRASSAGDFPAVEPGTGGAPGPETEIRLHELFEQRDSVFIRERRTLGSGHVLESFMAFPLVTTQGTLGMLCVDTAPPHASLTDLDFSNFGSFAEYAALIIDNFFKYKELVEKRDAEYRALQAQIQPHFLYNVLNGLIGLNRMGDSRTLESAIFSLKDMLRYILDQGRWTTLGEELRFLGRYCELQKMRFSERLVVTIRCDAEVADVRIPKLILQPIVENAVIHGIEPLDRSCHLEITAEQLRANGTRGARIFINDDGVGYIASATHSEERIGLTNARERLQISYPDARLSIASAPGSGTRICIEIPEGRQGGEDPDRG